MKDVFQIIWEWLIDEDRLFTIITVIASGLISLGISALYFKKSNRNALLSEILYPLCRILEEDYSWKNYSLLSEISSKYNSKYLKRKEQKAINSLLSAYKTVCRYKYETVCADSLFSYFCYKLEQNGINTKIEPIYCDGEIVDLVIPSDVYHNITDSLAQAIENNPPDFNEESCLEVVQIIFKDYCKNHFSDKKIVFFDDYSLEEVLTKAKNSVEWSEKLSNFEKARAVF